MANEQKPQTVIFDTNAYRVLTVGTDEQTVRQNMHNIVNNEQSQNFQAIANPVVCQELITHLSDTNDPSYYMCLKGLVALYEHCKISDTEGIRFVADCESLVCKLLFGRIPQDSQNIANVISSLICNIADDPANIISEAKKQIDVIALGNQNREQLFVDMIKHHAGTTFPFKDWEICIKDKKVRDKLLKFFRSDDFLRSFAAIMVAKHASLVETELEEEDISSYVDIFLDNFQTPMELYRQIWQRMLISSFNMEHPKRHRENLIWDFAICFCVGPDHTIDGADVKLITGDGAMRDAAKECGCDDKVMILENYLDLIGCRSFLP